jgi:hypothetical protein
MERGDLRRETVDFVGSFFSVKIQLRKSYSDSHYG